MATTPNAAAPTRQPNASDKISDEYGRWCSEHGAAAIFDVDCFRCPHDNAVIGPAIR